MTPTLGQLKQSAIEAVKDASEDRRDAIPEDSPSSPSRSSQRFISGRPVTSLLDLLKTDFELGYPVGNVNSRSRVIPAHVGVSAFEVIYQGDHRAPDRRNPGMAGRLRDRDPSQRKVRRFPN